MKHKTIALIAIVMVVVFGGITVLYPMLFHSEPATIPDAGVAPGTLPAAPAPGPVVPAGS